VIGGAIPLIGSGAVGGGAGVRQSLLLEPLAREFQRPAVLGDGAHDVIRHPGGEIAASISSVTVTVAPTSPERCAITSSAMRLASRPTRAVSSVTAPWEAFGLRRHGLRI
jgi:hypothetical protein